MTDQGFRLLLQHFPATVESTGITTKDTKTLRIFVSFVFFVVNLSDKRYDEPFQPSILTANY